MAEPLSISRRFARWARRLTIDDLAPQVVDKVKGLILFATTAAVFGHGVPHSRDLLELVRHDDERADGATVIGAPWRATRQGAVLANAELMHSAGLYDSFRMLTHPGPALVSTGIVYAELERRSGADLIVALAAGYEIECRLADAFVPAVAARGHRPSPIFSTVGAAVVAGSLLVLDENGLVTTIAVAANSASGLFEGGRTGGVETVFHEPNAARQGAFAASMSTIAPGPGSELSIEGAAGFYATYAGSAAGDLSISFDLRAHVDPLSVTDGLGEDFALLNVMFRIYDTAGFNQPVIELMRELRQEEGLTANEIDAIEITMNDIETLYPSPRFPRFPDINAPRVDSTPYYAAQVALYGGVPAVGQRPFAPADVTPRDDPALWEMMSRITLTGVPGHPMFSPAVTVRTTDGRSLTRQVDYAERVWDFAGLLQVLRSRVDDFPGGWPLFERLVTAVDGLDRAPDIESLLEALRPAESGA